MTGGVRTCCKFWIFSSAPTAPWTFCVLIQPDNSYVAFGLTVTVVVQAASVPSSESIDKQTFPVRPGASMLQRPTSFPLQARENHPRTSPSFVSSNEGLGNKFVARVESAASELVAPTATDIAPTELIQQRMRANGMRFI